LKKIGPFLKLEKDKLTIQYTGPGNQYQDVGSIRSDAAFSATSVIDYFEIKVLSAGKRNMIMIGITSEHEFVSTKHPGWDPNSYGYHSADGRIYSSGRHGKLYGPTYEEGDVVGCGINYYKKEIFFTRNGIHLGPAYTGFQNLRYFPTIGLHSPNERVTANFIGPFQYDVRSAIEEVRLKIAEEINQIPISVPTINELLRDYLYYEGYTESLASFEKMANLAPKQISDTLVKRRQVCSLIEQGQTHDALNTLIKYFPEALHTNLHVIFRIQCQCFVELIKKGQIFEAVEWARRYLSGYLVKSEDDQMNVSNGPSNDIVDDLDGLPETKIRKLDLSKSDEHLLLETVGLLAYESPNDSPLKYLLEDDKRQELSNDVNKLILESQKQEAYSALERSYMQLAICRDMLSHEALGCGDALKFNL
jgi:hypothetical protein